MTEFTVVEEVTDPASEIDLQTARLETTPFVEVGEVVEIPTAAGAAHVSG